MRSGEVGSALLQCGPPDRVAAATWNCSMASFGLGAFGVVVADDLGSTVGRAREALEQERGDPAVLRLPPPAEHGVRGGVLEERVAEEEDRVAAR